MSSKKKPAKPSKDREKQPAKINVPAKKENRILLKYTLIILIALIVMAALLFFPVMKSMKPSETSIISKNLFVFKQKIVNFYLVSDGKRYIAIDTGMDAQKTSLQLKEAGIHPDLISAVFLTHSDYDHAGGAKAFKKAKIYISTAEKQMIDGTTKRKIFGIKRSNRIDVTPLLLKDGQLLRIGKMKIKGILTPGHTPGSMSYLVNDKMLFTGDLAQLKGGILTVFTKPLNNDTAQSEQSLEKLINMLKNVEFVGTAHSGWTEDYMKAISGIPQIP